MTKILYIITLSELGGAQRYVADLAMNLPKDRYEITVAAGENGPLLKLLETAGIETKKLDSLVREINPLKDIAAYFEIKKLVKKLNPDVVHLNSSKAGVIGAIAAKHAGVKKVIYTAHGFVFNEPMPGWKKTVYQLAERFSARYKDALICVSDFDRQVGIQNRIAPSEKLVVIHNGINQLALLDKKAARQSVNLPQDKTIIGTVANFYPTKDLLTLVRAAKILVEQNAALQFAIIGDGLGRHQLTAEIERLELKQVVTLCGQHDTAGQYLNRHFKLFDIYVCSSVKEGFPYSILEAMAAGLPIVSTNVGGIPEALTNKKNGLLVEPKNPQALAEAITLLLTDKKTAEQLGAQARHDVEEKFSLKQMIQATEKVYT